MGDNDEYPTWKKAIMGNSHAANAYCAVKYVLWHSLHVVLAIITLALVGAVRVSERLGGSIGQSRVHDAMTGEMAKKSGFAGAILYFVVLIGYAVYLLITEPLLFGGMLAAAFILAGLLLLMVRLEIDVMIARLFRSAERTTVDAGSSAIEAGSKIRQKSEKKPITRRILGYCPVSMSIDPKWFESLMERLDDED